MAHVMWQLKAGFVLSPAVFRRRSVPRRFSQMAARMGGRSSSRKDTSGTGARLAEYLSKKEGMFAVDKPQGKSSFDVVDIVRKGVVKHLRDSGVQVRKLLDVKCGHGGTLDPLATGVLVVAIGKACKSTNVFLKGSKKYSAVGKLGADTNTLDSEGTVINEVSCDHITADDIKQVLPQFIGNIMQTPPAFSALKVNGQTAYKLARAGKEVELETRPITVHSIELTRFENPEFELDIHCGSGTYVRTLIQDIAHAVNGAAHMIALQRTQQGPFTIADTIPAETAMDGAVVFETIAKYREIVEAYLHKAEAA